MAGSRKATGNVIVYVGTADERIIGDPEKPIIFNRENSWTVPASDVPSDLEEVLKEHHSDEFHWGGGEEVDDKLDEKNALSAGKDELNQHQPPPSNA